MSYSANWAMSEQTWHLVENKLIKDHGDVLGPWIANHYTYCGKSLRMEDDWGEDDNYIFDDNELMHRCFHYICPDCAEQSHAYGLVLLARTPL